MSGRSAIARKQKAHSDKPHHLIDRSFTVHSSPAPSVSHRTPPSVWSADSFPRRPMPAVEETFAYHHHQHQHHQFQHHGPPPGSPYQGQSYIPALNIIDLDFERSPPLSSPSGVSRARANSTHARSGTSMSSWSSLDGSSPPSRVEKSALRAFVDSKSDALRSKLSFKSTARKQSMDQLHHSPRPSRGAHVPTRTPFTPPSSHATVIEMPTSAPRPRSPPGRSGFPPSPVDHPMSNTGESTTGSTVLPQSGGRFGEHLSAVKRWVGGGKPSQPWSKLRKVRPAPGEVMTFPRRTHQFELQDPELWDPTGDTLVYLGNEAHGTTRPAPSLRVHSSVLEETGSAFFTTILREGYIDQVDYDLPMSPASPSPSAMVGVDGLRDVSSRLEQRDDLGPLPSRSRGGHGLHSMHSVSGQPTPPTSEPSIADRDHPVLYELFFPAPLDASTVENLRHHLTTRNVFALLFGKSLVGLNLYQSLLDLHERLQMYMPPESDNASLIIDHIVSHGVDDVRNEPASAAGLLAWSEGPAVRWHEGWREAFVHCTGMYSRLRHVPEFRDVSHFSRILLERASLEIQVRVQQAADKLADFDFADMWPMQSVLPPPARDSFDRFRRFLSRHYEAVFWSWPPLPRFGTAEIWLTRDVINRLQTDFGALYDYLVDRDLVWEAGTPQDRQWRIVSQGLKPNFRADADGLPLTDMFLGFDNRCGYPHIPHPFPLLPPTRPLQIPMAKPTRFGKKTRPVETRFAERRVALEYSEATNVFRLGPDFAANGLVDAFAQFEKADMAAEVDPCQARKGRWVLIYGVLQVLATVAVDTPGLRFREKVPYYVNPRLRGTPPWRDKRDPSPEEASHERSHCWTTPRTWKEVDHTVERSGLRNHREIVIKGLGDGTGRSLSLDDVDRAGAHSRKDSSNARQWMYTSDGQVTGPATNGHATKLHEKKPSDWPIRTRGVAASDYVPPEDW